MEETRVRMDAVKEHKTIVRSDVTNELIEKGKVVEASVVIRNKSYVVDLDGDRLENELAELTLARVIEIGRKEKPAGARSAVKKERLRESRRARQWARDNGIEVADRGQVPREIMDRYKEFVKNGGSTKGSGGSAEDQDGADAA